MRAKLRATTTLSVMALICQLPIGCASTNGGGSRAPLAPPMIGASTSQQTERLAADEAPMLLPPGNMGAPTIQEISYTETTDDAALLLPIPIANAETLEIAPSTLPYNDTTFVDSPSDPIVYDAAVIDQTGGLPPLALAGEHAYIETGAACVDGSCEPRGWKLPRPRLPKVRSPWKREPRRDIGNQNPYFPRELRLAKHPSYIVEPPDVLYIEALPLEEDRPLAGERLVRQDGTVSLGYYGAVHVAGHSLDEIEEIIRQRLREGGLTNPDVYVDIVAFNSKVYYVLGEVEQTGQLPITGKETVLDALTLAGGVTRYAKWRDIHVARPNPGGGCDQILHVDYHAITNCGDTRTNYQLLPGDRVVVPPTWWHKMGIVMENFVRPFEPVGAILNPFGYIAIALDD